MEQAANSVVSDSSAAQQLYVQWNDGVILGALLSPCLLHVLDRQIFCSTYLLVYARHANCCICLQLFSCRPGFCLFPSSGLNYSANPLLFLSFVSLLSLSPSLFSCHVNNETKNMKKKYIHN